MSISARNSLWVHEIECAKPAFVLILAIRAHWCVPKLLIGHIGDQKSAFGHVEEINLQVYFDINVQNKPSALVLTYLSRHSDIWVILNPYTRNVCPNNLYKLQ